MNGRLAKAIRKKVYGPDGAPRFRQYSIKMPKGYQPRMSTKDIIGLIQKHGKSDTGQIFADKQRQLYQLTKKTLRRSEYGRG